MGFVMGSILLGFRPTHPFKPAKKNKPLDDRMHRLSMSTWPRRCHRARWQAHSTLLPYPTSKWAALVLSQMGTSRKVASPCNVDLSSPEGSTQMNLPSTKLWWIRWFETSHAITFQTLAVRTLNGTGDERLGKQFETGTVNGWTAN